MAKHQPLLGQMARWFNEVSAADALRLLLVDETLRSAFLSLVGRLADTDLSAIRSFERERPIAEGRLDLEGIDLQLRPRLIIEAKFGHTMSQEQMRRYLLHQEGELDGLVAGVLLLLVPLSRMREATGIMEFLASSGPPRPEGQATVKPLALSWEQCLTVMAEAVAHDAGPVSLAADVAQVRALTDALSAWTTPLAEVPTIEREDFLRVVLDSLKTRVPARDVGPLQPRDPDYLVFRYFGVPGASGTAYSIGLAPRVPSEGRRRHGRVAALP